MIDSAGERGRGKKELGGKTGIMIYSLVHILFLKGLDIKGMCIIFLLLIIFHIWFKIFLTEFYNFVLYFYMIHCYIFAYAWKNKSFSYNKNTHFIFYGSYPFCAYFERYMLSPKIRAKRVRVIKDKLCIFIIRETFVLLSICQKCQHTQIKAFLCFGIKEKNTKRGGTLYIVFLF